MKARSFLELSDDEQAVLHAYKHTKNAGRVLREIGDDKLVVTMCKTHDNKPLATVYGLPGYGADLTPERLQALAVALFAAAAECAAQPMGKGYRLRVREYSLASAAPVIA